MIDSEEDDLMDNSDPCSTNKITILLAGFLSTSLILFSMIPCFCGGYERTPSRGWLTSSLVVAYITYLTFSAVFAQVNIDIVDRYGENGEFTYPDGTVVTEDGSQTGSCAFSYNLYRITFDSVQNMQEIDHVRHMHAVAPLIHLNLLQILNWIKNCTPSYKSNL